MEPISWACPSGGPRGLRTQFREQRTFFEVFRGNFILSCVEVCTTIFEREDLLKAGPLFQNPAKAPEFIGKFLVKTFETYSHTFSFVSLLCFFNNFVQ